MRRLRLTNVQILIGVLLLLIASLIGGQIYRTTKLQDEVTQVADVPEAAEVENLAGLQTADKSLDQLEFDQIEAEAMKLDADISIE